MNVLVVALALVVFMADLQQPPLVLEFQRMAGPSGARKQAFDADKQDYFLHIHDIARFRVKAVSADFHNRPVVLRISGMLDKPEGPLEMTVPDANAGKGKTYRLFHEGFDKDLFRIDRKDGVTTIEFLTRGRQLLRPGTSFQYVDFYRN